MIPFLGVIVMVIAVLSMILYDYSRDEGED